VATHENIAGVIGIDGSGGTAIVIAGIRALPVGVPKLLVSTLALVDTAPYVGVRDIVMMPSITDPAGLNGDSNGFASLIVGLGGISIAELLIDLIRTRTSKAKGDGDAQG
jgi:uncharacterized protein (UPF0261 family)